MFKATQGLFLYKDEQYQQINGVTMGSQLGPTLANLFMANSETKLINKLQPSKAKLYLRYVDDILQYLITKKHVLHFSTVQCSISRNKIYR